jgi:hypothetical protein
MTFEKLNGTLVTYQRSSRVDALSVKPRRPGATRLWREAERSSLNEHTEAAVDLRSDHEKIQELGAFIKGRLRLVLPYGGKREAVESDSGDERQKQHFDMGDVLEQSSEGSDHQSPQRTPADVLLALTEL